MIVPPLWRLEVTNVILIAEKRARIKSVEVIKIIDFLNSLPLNISNLNFSIHEIKLQEPTILLHMIQLIS